MQRYLTKHAFHKEPLIRESPIPDLAMIVVIPAYKEESLIPVLDNLLNCDETEAGIEVIVVINHSEDCNDEIRKINETTFYESVEWSALHSVPERRFHVLYQPDLPHKKAGVGLARKIGMDEAVRRFEQIQNPNGVIVCLDADCRVDKNYLVAIEQFFNMQPKIEGCSIHFQHILEGLDADHRKAIIDYEMHLRYFIGMQRWAGCPYAYQTIGSAMAVRADIYCNVGGMNLRQAGEDFYFLHKVIERGAFSELNTTTVMPSPRVSDRVPFGTGRAMLNQLEKGEALLTYHPATFYDLKHFIQLIPLFYSSSRQNVEFLLDHQITSSLRTFLQSVEFIPKLTEIRTHTASPAAFWKRFFRWFNAFMLMKYVHFARDNFYPSVPVKVASTEYASMLRLDLNAVRIAEDLLCLLRIYDSGNG